MSFADSLAPYSAAVIVAALGCPRQTAYSWLDGSRKPPEWQQTLFLAAIQRAESTPKIEQDADDKRRKRLVRERRFARRCHSSSLYRQPIVLWINRHPPQNVQAAAGFPVGERVAHHHTLAAFADD